MEKTKKAGKKVPMSRNKKFLMLTLMPVYFLVIGLLLQPFGEIVTGVFKIIVEPDFLITDYMALGGIGASFVNAALVTCSSIAMIYFLKMEMTGHTITSVSLMFGFALFGKNIVNIWAILLGIFVYSKYHKAQVSQYIYIGFYGTCLAPIITQMMYASGLSGIWGILFGSFIGVLIGFLLPPLASHVQAAHKGYSLYNVGFAAGLLATLLVSVFKSFGFSVESRLIWLTGSNWLLFSIFGGFFLLLIILGACYSKGAIFEYGKILKTSGIGGTDYIRDNGLPAVMINMGVNGLVSTILVMAVGGDLNGPTLGAIFTIVGFSSTGKHVRNILPVMFGVCLGGWLKSWNIADPSPILALILSTTLAPIAGEFGIVWGIVAGFLHSSVVLNVGVLYSGMNLYNNGFSGGLVATVLVPIIRSFKDRKARVREKEALQ